MDVIQATPAPPGGGNVYSWLSKGIGTGMNKHSGWIVAVLVWWGAK
jgi:hypothetical protein